MKALRNILVLSVVAGIAACGPAAKPANKASPATSKPVAASGKPAKGGKGGATAAAAPVATPPPSRQVASSMGSQNPQAQASFREAVDLLAKIRKDGSGSYDQPIAKLEGATALDSDFAVAWYDLGTIYEDLGKYDKAADSFSRAQRANGQLGEATASLGRIYLLRGDVGKAKSFYNEQLARDPKNKEVRNHLAEVYRLEKNFSGAQEEIKKVLFADPDNVEAYKTLALVFMDQKKFDMAKMTCANALKIDQKNAGVYNALGLVFLAQNDIRSGAAQFQTALDNDPGYSPALANLGSIALDHRDYNLAADCFGRLAKLKPSSPTALNAYAVALRGQKKYDEAKGVYQRVHELDSTNTEVSFNLGVLYQKGYNDPTTAMRYYQDYIQKAGITDPKAPVYALMKRAEDDAKAQEMMKNPPAPKPTEQPANVAQPDKGDGAVAPKTDDKNPGTETVPTKDKPKAEKSGTSGAAAGSAGKAANH